MAQDEPWPTHPVRLIAASGPGGNPDVLARLLAEKFTAAFGKPFIVENVPGAGGIVAANMVAKSPPDGHVLMFGDSGALAINPALNPSLGYDPIKDFAPVTALVSLPTILSANPAVPADTLAEFIALAKKEPGKMSYRLGRRRLDPSSDHGDLRRPHRHRPAARALSRRLGDGERPAHRRNPGRLVRHSQRHGADRDRQAARAIASARCSVRRRRRRSRPATSSARRASTSRP